MRLGKCVVNFATSMTFKMLAIEKTETIVIKKICKHEVERRDGLDAQTIFFIAFCKLLG